MKRHFRIAFLLAIVVLAYSNTLVNSFTLDDKIYIDLNPQVTDVSLRGLFAANKLANVFRPLTFATLALNWKIGGTRPFGYHLFNLLLHGAATLLFYLLLEAIFFELSQGAPSPRDKLVAFAAALIFAVHPIHTEAVSSIVGRAEIACRGLHLRGMDPASEGPPHSCVDLLRAGVAVEGVGGRLSAADSRGRLRAREMEAASLVCAGGRLTLLYLAVLWKVQGGHLGRASITPLDNPLAESPGAMESPERAARGMEICRAAFLSGQAFLRLFLQCHSGLSRLAPHAAGALCGVAVVGAWIAAIGSGKSALILVGGIYLIGFATTANILLPTGTIMGERLAYLPSAGFCLLVALGWSWLRDRQRLVALAALTAVVAASPCALWCATRIGGTICRFSRLACARRRAARKCTQV